MQKKVFCKDFFAKVNILLKSVTVLVLATNKGWQRTNIADGCRVDEDGDEDAIALGVFIVA